ncbi:MAG: restriction endonuclease subunit S, partial [Candidatus Marinimicrobia bacterium]|nr:restriction endonuclease subunit S [Candidatus Neomarinimicrobiota bacterium]
FVSEGIPFVNAGHLDNGKVIIENLNYITQENYNLLSRGKFSIGDILFCLRGSLGKYAMIDSLERGAIASSLVIVRVTKELINNFLFYYFDSPICIKMIEEYAGGTAQPNLGAKDLAKFNISYPPLDEQKRTVAKLDALYSQTQSLESNYQQELDALDELKKSILQKAFSGELTIDNG